MSENKTNTPQQLLNTQSNSKEGKLKIRNSNLELYRIIVMFLIVAHHYVCNSPLYDVINSSPLNLSTLSIFLFGAWGKTGINCFVLITGYFLCTSSFSKKKLLKLYLQITFYALIIYGIFCITGHDEFNLKTFLFKLNPVRSIKNNFVGCFLIFYLFIPFLNIFVKSLNKKQHQYLVLLLIGVYSVLPSFTSIEITFNYVEWFIVLYFLASYMRFYGSELKITSKQWGLMALLSLLVSSISIIAFLYAWKNGFIPINGAYYFLSDSNKFLALLTALTSFMWFKDLKLKYIPFINIIGATTFGILLIHANSDVMRQWLWKEVIQPHNHFGASFLLTFGYALGSVITIFSICAFIECLRIKLIEGHLNKGVINLLKSIHSKRIKNLIALD